MKKFNKKHMIFLIISFFISLSINLKTSINYKKQLPDYFINKFQFNIVFFLKTFFLAIIIILFLLIICKLINKIKIKKHDEYNNKRLAILFFAVLFLNNLLFLLTYYPGSNMNDTLLIIKSPIGMSSQHPLVYNLLLSGTYHIFYKIFQNSNISFFLTSITQTIIIDIILTYILVWFNKTFKNKLATIILFIYFVFVPIISNYNTVLIKDSLFAGFSLLLIPLIYKIIKTKGECFNNYKYLTIYSCVSLSISLIRNNGIYIIIMLFIILLIKYKKYLKNIIIALIITLILSKIPSFIGEKKLFQEKVGIPIQQISYVVTYNQKGISDEDKKYINKIMNLNDIKENYNPYSVDTIKWNDKFNRPYLNKTKEKFIKTWISIMKNNFLEYVKSYLLTTYELYSIEKFNPVQSRFLGLDTTYEKIDGLKHKNIFSKKTERKLDKFYKKTTIYFSNGTCFIILLILIFYIVYIKKNEYLLLTIPLLGTWLTLMISAPIAYALRYMAIYVYYLPIIILIILLKKSQTMIK